MSANEGSGVQFRSLSLHHTAPLSTPKNFQGQNTSSTSIKITWGDVPKELIHGILLGFHVACKSDDNGSDRHFKDLVRTEHKWTFRRLRKYRNYSCQLRAYTNFGIGNWSEKLVISTDEDGMFIEGERKICTLIKEFALVVGSFFI